MKKGLFFLLFILILPSVNAFLDLRGAYVSTPELFDFLIFFLIFGIVARISFGRFFGGDEPLQKALSVVVALALAFRGVYLVHLSLTGIGDFLANSPIFWFLIAIFLFFGLFRLVKWVCKRVWLSLLITILLSLCLVYIIFPDSVLRRIPLEMDLIGNVISFLAILFVIFLFVGLIALLKPLLGRWSSQHPRELREPRERKRKSLIPLGRIIEDLRKRRDKRRKPTGDYRPTVPTSRRLVSPKQMDRLERERNKRIRKQERLSKKVRKDLQSKKIKPAGTRPIGGSVKQLVSPEQMDKLEKERGERRVKEQKMVRHLEYLYQKKDMALQKWQMMAANGVDGAKQKVRTLKAELEEISRKMLKYRY